MLPLLCLGGIFLSCSQSDVFVKQNNGRFEINGKPYYYIGANFWYGAMLGSTGQGGDRERLRQELDFMQSIGITNLRVLVGADGPDGQPSKVRPALQIAPGVYNDTIFDGLDFFLSELGKRKMYAVLFLNNSWDWSGGYTQYLEWANIVPDTAGAMGWQQLTKRLAQYATCDVCKEMFFDHVKTVLSRTNRYTNKKYTEDPAIMAWQVGNEPRAFSDEAKPAFTQWIQETTALIRSLDKNHLISIGNEGAIGCENDIQLFETIHADPNVDYLTIHIWPKNWNWIFAMNPDAVKQMMETMKNNPMYGAPTDGESTTRRMPDIAAMSNVAVQVDKAIEKTKEYIDTHTAIAEKLQKPMVIEEFGYPRDNHRYELQDPVTGRNNYYEYIFSRLEESCQVEGVFSGCNFWAWAGFGRPANLFWQPWDNYLGDPSQEEQGLNAVFNEDSTIELIKKYADTITK
ncbi:MAG: cellulase family glycosylhydrolase [Candidatus Symbiothrix sp.]|nr:cellulase family glycosylhydrolase [Candidatus Symbiothrix sp.]